MCSFQITNWLLVSLWVVRLCFLMHRHKTRLFCYRHFCHLVAQCHCLFTEMMALHVNSQTFLTYLNLFVIADSVYHVKWWWQWWELGAFDGWVVLCCPIGIDTRKDWKKLIKHRWPCHSESISHISVFGGECRSADFSDPRRYYFSLHIRDLFEQHDHCTLSTEYA